MLMYLHRKISPVMSLVKLPDFNLEDIDLDAFNNMTLSAEDEAREAVFLRAQKECLHGTPVDSSAPSRRGNRAWVVFNGRELGVFGTW